MVKLASSPLHVIASGANAGIPSLIPKKIVLQWIFSIYVVPIQTLATMLWIIWNQFRTSSSPNSTSGAKPWIFLTSFPTVLHRRCFKAPNSSFPLRFQIMIITYIGPASVSTIHVVQCNTLFISFNPSQVFTVCFAKNGIIVYGIWNALKLPIAGKRPINTFLGTV